MKERIQMDNRPSKIEANLLIARDIALRSPCTRRKFGAILERDGCIISTGYNGSSRGTRNCGIDCPCLKDLYKEETMKSYDHCPAVHAEMNVIINAARNGTSTIGTTLYLNTPNNGDRPCFLCRRFMIQAGVKDCYYVNGDGKVVHEEVNSWIQLENMWMIEQETFAPAKNVKSSHNP